LLFFAPEPLRIAFRISPIKDVKKRVSPWFLFWMVHCVRWNERSRKNFSDEIFPHCVWEKKLTGIIRKIRSASPKSPSDFPNISQFFWCGLPHQKTSDNSNVILNYFSAFTSTTQCFFIPNSINKPLHIKINQCFLTGLTSLNREKKKYIHHFVTNHNIDLMARLHSTQMELTKELKLLWLAIPHSLIMHCCCNLIVS